MDHNVPSHDTVELVCLGTCKVYKITDVLYQGAFVSDATRQFGTILPACRLQAARMTFGRKADITQLRTCMLGDVTNTAILAEIALEHSGPFLAGVHAKVM